jgi:hypothetical protein
MIETLLIVLGILIVLLWLMTMVVWWRSEQDKPVKTLTPDDAIQAWNKAARMGRRTWYSSVRHSKRAANWSNKKASDAFITVFPKSKAAFEKPDELTGLEHGPSSYYLASLSKPAVKIKPPMRKRKIVEIVDQNDLSV